MYSLTALVNSKDRAENIANTLMKNKVTDGVVVTKVNGTVMNKIDPFKVNALLTVNKYKTEQLRRLFPEVVIVETKEIE